LATAPRRRTPTRQRSGGDVIHYQAANNLKDAQSSFIVVMTCLPGAPMLTLVGPDELARRRDRRFHRG